MNYKSAEMNVAYEEGFEDAKKSLRDEFAGRAMQALLNKYTPDHEKYYPSTKPIVETAYDIADQMMEARK